MFTYHFTAFKIGTCAILNHSRRTHFVQSLTVLQSSSWLIHNGYQSTSPFILLQFNDFLAIIGEPKPNKSKYYIRDRVDHPF